MPLLSVCLSAGKKHRWCIWSQSITKTVLIPFFVDLSLVCAPCSPLSPFSNHSRCLIQWHTVLTIVCQYQGQSAWGLPRVVSDLWTYSYCLPTAVSPSSQGTHVIEFSHETATLGCIILSPWKYVSAIWFKTSRRCRRWCLIPEQWVNTGQLSSAANLSLRSALININCVDDAVSWRTYDEILRSKLNQQMHCFYTGLRFLAPARSSCNFLSCRGAA